MADHSDPPRPSKKDHWITISRSPTAHGIGTARMLALDSVAGAFSSLATSLTGLAAGILLPILLAAWAR